MKIQTKNKSQSYPEQYPTQVIPIGNICICIRPLAGSDAPLFKNLVENLSQRSRYFRFFSAITKLPEAILVNLTHIDYRNEIALAAVATIRNQLRMLGVARVITTTSQDEAEFSVLVADAYQGKGIGAELLKQCIDIAKDRGVRKIWGIVMAENTQMIALGRKLGFHIQFIPGCSEYELTLIFDYHESA